MRLQDYIYLGTTQSLCPTCLGLVPAKIIVRGERVYFRKQCHQCGPREDYVCSDWKSYDQLEYSLPAKIPQRHAIVPNRGCPYDCGLCTEHEQHTCIGLVEITDSCNLTCPLCYAGSAPGGRHRSVAECCQAIDHLVRAEGRPEVLQLSGGEPTVHPQFSQILRYAAQQPIDYIQINTNGIRIAQDPDLVALLSEYRDRLEVFFQFDAVRDDVYQKLRGESLLDTKLRALDLLEKAEVQVTLAATLQGGVNDDQPGPLVKFGLARRGISGINFQPATYSGRFVLPERLEQRITFPQVIASICQQTENLFQPDDFMPLPCAHPNCHSLAYAYRTSQEVVPLMRFIDGRNHLDLLANGVALSRRTSRDNILQYLARQGCQGGNCAPPATYAPDLLNGPLDNTAPHAPQPTIAQQFFEKAIQLELGAQDVFRIMITSFLDAYNFDIRRLMKCCTHHVLPSGHIIPFCAYNVLYRTGHVPLPALESGAAPERI